MENKDISLPDVVVSKDTLESAGPRPITDADLVAENNAGYQLGHKHGKGEMQDEIETLRAKVWRFFELDPVKSIEEWQFVSSELIAMTKPTAQAASGFPAQTEPDHSQASDPKTFPAFGEGNSYEQRAFAESSELIPTCKVCGHIGCEGNHKQPVAGYQEDSGEKGEK
jgi:hypothetical protein